MKELTDGLEYMHDPIRGNGRFDPVMEGIKLSVDMSETGGISLTDPDIKTSIRISYRNPTGDWVECVYLGYNKILKPKEIKKIYKIYKKRFA